MARHCTICEHQQRAEIEKCLLGREPFRRIAKRFGTSDTALVRHRDNHLPHLAAVQEHVAAAVLEMAAGADIVERTERVKALGDRWNRLRQVIAARAADPDHAKAPGGDTGLLVRKLKQIGSGESARTVEEYEVDAALLREAREHEKQAAQELGQWNEETPGGKVVQVVMLMPGAQVSIGPSDESEGPATIDITPGR